MDTVCSEEQMSGHNISILRVNKFSKKIRLEAGDILFYPILFKYEDFVTFHRMKKEQPWKKVYATVHGLRNIDYYFDINEQYYFKRFAKAFFIQPTKE